MEENFNAANVNETNVSSSEKAQVNEDALAELVKLSKRQLFFQKVGTGCLAGMLAVLIIAVAIMIPKVTTTLNHINNVAVKAQDSLDKVDSMTSDISGSAENFDKLLNENGKELTEAVHSLSEIDFEGLNKAIQDLQDAVGPMATFMNKFR